ncbi:hypothetical protein BaRGS_00023892 [Batillaria attramentaria]|uniref:Uncharacterized protein n=1 Tax=Batillaria attramentaria TaxID=370345 RepID=A0ABD0KCI5_9CAEN
MSLFIIRSTGYQVGIVAVFVATGFVLIGVVSPMWLYHHDDVATVEDERFAGPILGCRMLRRSYNPGTYKATTCTFGFLETFSGERYTPSTEMTGKRYMDTFDVGSWVHAVEVFVIVGFLVLCGSCTYTMMDNCCKLYPGPHNRIIEITALVGGVLCFISTMIFVGKMRESVEDTVQTSFSWALVLTIIGSLIAVAAAIVVALFNKALPQPGSSVTHITISNDYATVVQGVNAAPMPAKNPAFTRY